MVNESHELPSQQRYRSMRRAAAIKANQQQMLKLKLQVAQLSHDVMAYAPRCSSLESSLASACIQNNMLHADLYRVQAELEVQVKLRSESVSIVEQLRSPLEASERAAAHHYQ